MDGDQGDRDAPIVEHHDRSPAKALSKQFGVAGEGAAGQMDGRLADRGGDQGVSAAVLARCDGVLQAGQGRHTGSGLHLAGDQVAQIGQSAGLFDMLGQGQAQGAGDAGQQGGIGDRDQRGAAAQGRVGAGAAQQFGTDPGRVSHAQDEASGAAS